MCSFACSRRGTFRRERRRQKWSCSWLIVYRTLNWLIIMVTSLSHSLWPRPERLQTCFGNPKSSPESQPSGSIVLPRFLETSPPPTSHQGCHPVHFIACRRGWGAELLRQEHSSAARGGRQTAPCAALGMGEKG